jgi:Domain of Unknown Function (DUF748)
LRALRRTLVIGGVSVVVALVVTGFAVFRHFTSPAYVETHLRHELGGDFTVHIGSSHYHLLARSLDASDVSIVADSLRKGDGQRRTLTIFHLPVVRARGVNFMALRHGTIDIDEIDLERPEARVYLDRHTVSSHPGPRQMPHEVLLASTRRVRIGKIHVANGDIQYAERPITGDHAGEFRFADIEATLTNLDIEASRAGKPCVIDVRTRLADSGPLHARFTYDLSSKPLKMDYRASMGRMDATALNKLLINLKGIRITGGSIDSLSADISMRDRRATGTVRFPYHGLKFEMLDKNSHERDIGDKFWTFMYSRKVHKSNPEDDDEPVTVATVERQRLPPVSLMKFVWETVREGVFQTANVPEPPAQTAAPAEASRQ